MNRDEPRVNFAYLNWIFNFFPTFKALPLDLDFQCYLGARNVCLSPIAYCLLAARHIVYMGSFLAPGPPPPPWGPGPPDEGPDGGGPGQGVPAPALGHYRRRGARGSGGSRWYAPGPVAVASVALEARAPSPSRPLCGRPQAPKRRWWP